MHSKSILVACLLFALTIDSFSQSHFSFSKLDINDGLSDGTINDIVQDAKGFIWIGTSNGLNRYDGHSFKVFRQDYEKPGALKNGNISALYVDRKNTLWVGTAFGGLYYFNADTESFFKCNTQRSDWVGSIYESSTGDLWVGFLGIDGGLGLYDPKADSLIKFNYKDPNPNSTRSTDYITAIRVIREDSERNLWIGTWGDGLLKLDLKTKTFHRVNNIDSCILSLHIDSKNNLWIGTFAAGLIKFNPVSNLTSRYRYSVTKPNSIPGDRVSSIRAENENLLWLATNGGLSAFDVQKGIFKNQLHSSYDSKSLSDNFLQTIYKDRTGLLWIGTQFHGVNILQSNKYKFHTLHIYDPADEHGISNDNVTSLLEDSSGNIWVGTFGGGLNKQVNTTHGSAAFTDARFKWYQYRGDQNKNTINTNGISSLMQDVEGNIWIAHGNGGINVLNQKKGQFESFRKNASSGLTEDRINSIFQDSKKRIWIGTFSGGLNLFDRELSKVDCVYDLIPNQKNTPASNNVATIFEDIRGKIWIGHRMPAGVDQYQEQSKNFLHLMVEDSGRIVFNHPRVSSIVQGDSGLIWFGTNNGVYGIVTDRDTLIRTEKGTIVATRYIRYSEHNGLQSNEISGLILHNGQLWASTNIGVSQIDLATNKITNYDEYDGLQRGRFYSGAILKKTTGHILIGGTNGISIFHPDSIRYNLSIPNIVITDIQILNKPVGIDAGNLETETDNFTLPKSITNLEEINIPYDLNVLTLQFASLDFTSPDKNQYAYKMEGFNRDWVDAGSNRSAAYTNLDPGSYIFRVKGSNNDGIWNEQGALLKITVLPPPWKTWEAYAGYSIGFVLLLLAGRNEIVKRERLKTKAKLKEAEAQKYHELDSLKSRFFANISHEFRTPLTLLIGPLERRLSVATESNDKAELSIMHRNASRLLTLVNQLLDLSRLEAGTLSLKAHKQSLNNFIPSIASQFSSMADSKKIHFEVRIERSVELYFDSDKLEKIITNLLSNAFKFTPSGGIITLSISQHGPTSGFKEGFAEIKIADSGPGIEKEHLGRIFDRFYQVDTSSTRKYEGSGIGLALTKELVELHHGTIGVVSTPGMNTCFTIQLPLGSTHLKANDIQDTNTESPSSRFLSDTAIPTVVNEPPIPEESLRPTLLIVEDNADLRFYLNNSLQDKYKVQEAADGEQGLAAARDAVPDLIISDLMMPKMDGLQLCERLKSDERTSHIPVILLTAKADIETKLHGLHLGADDYMAKPFDARELQARITNLIENRQMLQEKFSKKFNLSATEIKVESLEDRFLKKVKTAIETHLSDPAFGVEPLAEEVAMSTIQLYRKLKAITGQTPNELIRNIRLDRSASLLRQHSGNVSDVAYEVGFNNLSYFAKCFKDKFGVTPSEYQ